jgi:cell division protein FtsW
MTTKAQSYDQSILYIVIALVGVGTIMLYSASSTIAVNKYNNYYHYLFKHLKWLTVGSGIFYILTNINYRNFKYYTKFLLIISWVVMLLAFMFKPENVSTARWLILFGRNWLTTSDLARITLILFTASFLEMHKKQLHDWQFLLKEYLPYFAITMLLVISQPDTSTTLIMSLIIFTMLYIGGVRLKHLATAGLVGLIGVASMILRHPYQWERIKSFISGEMDDQKLQSLYALSNGGLFGIGFGDSIVKNGFLPEVHTDFILPIVGEEFGFIGILVIFALFLVLFHKGIKIVQESPDLFSMFLALGIILNIVFYFMVNALYVIGFAPTTGLPIPFISYGGSHTIYTLGCIGLLISIAKKSNPRRNTKYHGYSYE